MKKKEVIKQIIRDFHLRDDFDVKQRDLQVPVDTGKIITLIGVRRCGKTYMLYDTINKLSQKINKTQILFINFEDERLELGVDELDLVLQGYAELYPDQEMGECYFFFDEIQNINGWEKFVRRMYDTVSTNIFVTGSNARLLSTEIATSLRGRTLVYEVFPLSFREYLGFKGITIDLYSSKSLAHIKNAQESYLREGGFPEIATMEGGYKNQVLQEYFNVMLYRDLMQRYNITNGVALKFFIKRTISSTTKQLSINKIYNELKSAGVKIGKNTLYEFLEYVQSIYLATTLYRYERSMVKRELGEKKVYSIDVGLNNAIEYRFSDDTSKALENAFYFELRREHQEIYYYRDSIGECDFMITDKGKVVEAIQISYDISDDKTKKREIKGLLNVCKKFGIDSGTIVTYDTEDEIYEDGVEIKVLPFYKKALNR